MTLLLKYWAPLTTLVGVLLWGWHQAEDMQHHRDIEQARCDRIAQLEQIIVQEFPQYTAAFYYRGASHC